MLPEGFPKLVAVVIKDWGWDVLPRKESDIWDAFINPIFLGENVRSAQAGYAKEVLAPYLTMRDAQRARSDPNWSRGILKLIDAELNAIRGRPGEGLKRAILENIRGGITSDLTETLYTALQFFRTHNINVQEIRRIRNNRDETINLVDYAAREIHNVGYTKAVLWLYDCGIADDLAPPNAQIRRFLTGCGYSGFGWSRGYGVPEDPVIFAPLCQRMREVAEIVSRQLKRKKAVTAKQVQSAAWYLESCRGLPGMIGRGRRLTPKVLLDFLKSRGWEIGDLSERLGDVERLEDLGEELRSFLRL
jgi:hypothetical protein